MAGGGEIGWNTGYREGFVMCDRCVPSLDHVADFIVLVADNEARSYSLV
jgi:hypothetical protein